MMYLIYPFLLCSLLAVVIYQDFRYRALSVIVLSGISLVAVTNSVLVNGWKQSLIYVGTNALLIAIQLVGITAYFSLKHKRFTNIINIYLGSGDLWFYGIVACCFSPMNFVVFNIVACFLILVVYALIRTKSLQDRTIPFAGCLAIGLVMVVLSSRIFHTIDPYDDWILASKLFS